MSANQPPGGEFPPPPPPPPPSYPSSPPGPPRRKPMSAWALVGLILLIMGAAVLVAGGLCVAILFGLGG